MTASTKYHSARHLALLFGCLLFCATFLTSCYEDDGELIDPIVVENNDTTPDEYLRDDDCSDPYNRNFACR